MLGFSGMVQADDYSNAVNLFKESEAVKPFFDSAYGYVIFPAVGKGGLMYEASIGGQKFNYKPIE